MRFGPTSLKITGVLAKGLRRPKVRPDLRVCEQVVAGETTYMIKIPETESFIRFEQFEYQLLKLCDGTRTTSEITRDLNHRFPDEAVPEEELADWIDSVDPSLWERSPGQKSLAVLEKIRDERKKRVDSSSLVYVRFAAWDPNRLLDRIYPHLKWFYSRTFVVVSLVLFLATLFIVASDFSRIRQDTAAFYDFTQKTAYDLWIFWILLFVVSGIHEFGHGLTCKHYGGEVHQMGLLLIYFTPAFFTDCSEMYMFDRSSKRQWTIFAGIWIELVTCAVATLVWYFAPPGSFTGDLGYKVLLLTGVSGVFFNLNPLMKFDGYYVLSQYLEIDNLYDDSFEYWKDWLRKYILRQEVDLPPVGRRRRRIFLLYATGAFLYSALIILVVTLFVKNVFTSKFGHWGYLLTAGVVYLLLRKRVGKWASGLKEHLRDAKEKFMAWQMNRGQKVAVGGLLVFLVAVPFSLKTTSDFTLEPGRRAQVRALVAGEVAAVKVQEGQEVPAGAVLAVLRNPEVVARAERLEQELALAERALLAARARNDLGTSQNYAQERQRLRVALEEAGARRAALTLRTPLAGVVTTPRIAQRVGTYLAEGETLATVVKRTTLRARVLVRDRELEDVSVGAPVRLKLRAYPFRTFHGRIQQIMPAAAMDRPVNAPEKPVRKGQELMNYFAVVLEFNNQEGLLREGMTGTAKISGRRYPLAWQAGRAAWRWIRAQLW